MTSSTEFTQNGLPILESVTKLAQSKPRYLSGLASDAWNNLTSILQGIEVSVVTPILGEFQSTIANTTQTVTHNITGQVLNVQAQGNNAVNGILDPITDLINRLIAGIQSIIDTVKGWIDTVTKKIVDVVNSIGDWIGNIIDSATTWIVSAVDTLTNKVVTTVNNTINAVKDWLDQTTKNIVNVVNSVINAASTWINGVYQSIADFITQTGKVISQTYQGLKQSIEDKLQAILNWIETAKNNLRNWYLGFTHNVVVWVNSHMNELFSGLQKGFEGIVGMITLIIEKIAAGDFSGAEDLIDKFFRGLGLPAPVAIIRAIVSILVYFWETVHLQFVGLEYSAQKNALATIQLEPIDLSTAHDAVERGIVTKDWFIENAKRAGINQNKAEVFLQASEPLLPADLIRQVYLRGFISEPQHDTMLSAYGFTDDKITDIKTLYKEIPPITDLVHFADRWAWDDTIAQRFLYDTEFPDIVKEWAAKQGISQDWFIRYWRAHWQLPGLQDIFEMFHRLREGAVTKPFTSDDLDAYLKTTPLPPYFHDKLKAISYNPYTRVDIRRMYKAGVLDKAGVTSAYMDLGYDKDKADALTEFTIRYYAPDDQTQLDDFANQSRAAYSQGYRQHIISEDEYRTFLLELNYQPDDIEILVQIDNFKIIVDDKLFDYQNYRKDWQTVLLKAYDRGLIHENELRPMLIDLGYDDSEVTLEVSLSDYNRQLTMRNAIANQIHDQYVSFIIDNVGLHTILDQFNFTSEEIDKLQEAWDVERALRTKRPPLADIRKFWKAGLMSLEDYLDNLRGEGYNEKYIDMYRQTLSGAGA